jgi:hypothetical protein
MTEKPAISLYRIPLPRAQQLQQLALSISIPRHLALQREKNPLLFYDA